MFDQLDPQWSKPIERHTTVCSTCGYPLSQKQIEQKAVTCCIACTNYYSDDIKKREINDPQHGLMTAAERALKRIEDRQLYFTHDQAHELKKWVLLVLKEEIAKESTARNNLEDIRGDWSDRITEENDVSGPLDVRGDDGQRTIFDDVVPDLEG